MLQTISLALAIAVSVASVAIFVRGVVRLTAQIRLGGPVPRERLHPVGRRTWLVLREVLGHGRFTHKPAVRAAHWAVMLSFPILALTLASGFGQITNPAYRLPGLGSFAPWEWLTELIAWASLAGILWLIAVRQVARRRARGRFAGSTEWQAYVVEAVVLIVVACVLALRALEYAYLTQQGDPHASALHFPTTAPLGSLLAGGAPESLAAAITVVALAKIATSSAWLAVVGLQPTMGVAWHRFLAVINVYARRELDGSAAVGAAEPLRVDTQPLDIGQLDELPEDTVLGAATITDFPWKAQLDFATCTECGRCQEVCPAWNTDKPLSPKLLMMALRDQAGAVAAGEAEADTPLMPSIVDPDVLWSCTTCGACTAVCPVDIEHVDHVLDLRRAAVLMESAAPPDLGQMLRKLERRDNPWGMPASKRMDWAKGLDFPVPVLGVDLKSAAEIDYVLWVGCAGAFDDRGKKTTRALAELLHLAGVRFAVLGQAEACSGDPARRAGQELLFQELAQRNIETLNEYGVMQIVVSCAHCFNTFAREYPQLGGTYKVVHHTQLLNRLMRDGRLTLAPPPADEAATLTFHDPCYLGRHNGVVDEPRQLLEALGEDVVEMPRSGADSFCCGGGGARAFAEESLGTSIAAARATEAIDTGADTIVTGCPFCTVMLSDGVRSASSGAEGAPPATAPEVKDVAVLMLEAAKRGMAGPPPAPGAPAS